MKLGRSKMITRSRKRLKTLRNVKKKLKEKRRNKKEKGKKPLLRESKLV